MRLNLCSEAPSNGGIRELIGGAFVIVEKLDEVTRLIELLEVDLKEKNLLPPRESSACFQLL